MRTALCHVCNNRHAKVEVQTYYYRMDDVTIRCGECGWRYHSNNYQSWEWMSRIPDETISWFENSSTDSVRAIRAIAHRQWRAAL